MLCLLLFIAGKAQTLTDSTIVQVTDTINSDTLIAAPPSITLSVRYDSKGNFDSLNVLLNADSLIFNDFKSLHDHLQKQQLNAFKEGYLAYGVDSLVTLDSIRYTAFVHQGKVHQWGTVTMETQEQVLLKSGLDPQKLQGAVGDPQLMLEFYERLLAYYENNGYPFASVKMEKATATSEMNEGVLVRKIHGELKVNPGNSFVYDTLALHGDAKISGSYLQHYLGLIEGNVYQEKSIATVSKKLKELPFAVETKPASVEFRNGKALVHLYLKKKSANFFNGIVGVLPNSPQLSTVTSGSNVLITGDVKLTLLNSLRTGEKIDLTWKRLKPETQRLQTALTFPYLFNTAFGIDDELDLLKQDTSFINFSNQLGLIYALSSSQKLKVFWETKSTTILDDSDQHAAQVQGNNSNSYGVDYFVEQLDYRYNPRKGFRFNFVFQGGNRTLDGGSAADDQVEINIPSDDQIVFATALIPKTATIYKAKLDLEFYVPLFQLMALKIASKNAYIHNPYLFDNDLNRIGGFHLLRGFDEQSIFSSLYSVLTVEYRLLLEQNSFIAAFFDQAYTQKHTFLENEEDFPFGFGASINFQTKPGVFSVMYAVGRQKGNPVSFTSAKIHFGFISLF